MVIFSRNLRNQGLRISTNKRGIQTHKKLEPILQIKIHLTATRGYTLFCHRQHEICLIPVTQLYIAIELLLLYTECPNIFDDTELCLSHSKIRNHSLTTPYSSLFPQCQEGKIFFSTFCIVSNTVIPENTITFIQGLIVNDQLKSIYLFKSKF